MNELTPEQIAHLKNGGQWPKFGYETDEQWTERIQTAHWMHETQTKPMLDEARRILESKPPTSKPKR